MRPEIFAQGNAFATDLLGRRRSRSLILHTPRVPKNDPCCTVIRPARDAVRVAFPRILLRQSGRFAGVRGRGGGKAQQPSGPRARASAPPRLAAGRFSTARRQAPLCVALPDRRGTARVAPRRPERPPGSAIGVAEPPRARAPDREASLQAQSTHSPRRITGAAVPSGAIPSTSMSAEPIIQSMWMRLRFAPRAARSSSERPAPPLRKHLL